MSPRELAIIVLLPASMALVVLLAGWRPWRRALTTPSRAAEFEPRDLDDAPPPVKGVRTPWLGVLASALAISAGPIAADLLLRGWHGAWPRATIYFLPHVIILGVLASLTAPLWHPRRWSRAFVVVLVSATATYLATQHRIKNQWSTNQAAGWLSGLTFASTVLWLGLDALATRIQPAETSRLRGLALPVLGWLAFSAVSAVVLFSGAAALGQIGGAFAAACGSFAIVCAWRPGWGILKPAIPVVSLALPTLMTLQFYRMPIPSGTPIDDIPPDLWAKVPIASAGLVMLIPLAGWVGEVRAIRGRGAMARFVVPLIVGGLLALAAVWISIPPDKYNPLMMEQADDYYGP